MKLCANSDVVVLELEKINVQGSKWIHQLCPDLNSYLYAYGGYDFSSRRHLLRAIRNLYIHHGDLPANIQVFTRNKI